MDTDTEPNTLPRVPCMADTPHLAHLHDDLTPPHFLSKRAVWCEGVAGPDGQVEQRPSLRHLDPGGWSRDERLYGLDAPSRVDAERDKAMDR